jgi:hypothetical protein
MKLHKEQLEEIDQKVEASSAGGGSAHSIGGGEGLSVAHSIGGGEGLSVAPSSLGGEGLSVAHSIGGEGLQNTFI